MNFPDSTNSISDDALIFITLIFLETFFCISLSSALLFVTLSVVRIAIVLL
jgi:hypothetical protein